MPGELAKEVSTCRDICHLCVMRGTADRRLDRHRLRRPCGRAERGGRGVANSRFRFRTGYSV